MRSFRKTYRGASVLIAVNADLLLFAAALLVALLTAGFLGTL